MNSQITKSKPQLNEGEIYAGGIISPEGSENHIILLPGEQTSINYTDAVKWAAGIGGCLPTHEELKHLFAKSRAAKLRGDMPFYDFKDTFNYWSAEQYAIHCGSGASTLHLSGNYKPGIEGTYIRACAIRRVAFDI